MTTFPSQLKVYSVSGNGQLNVWEADTDLEGLIPYEQQEESESEEESGEESEEGESGESDADLQQVEDKVSRFTLLKRQKKEGY